MERKFAIVTDSAGDMPAAYYEENKVEVVRLGFTLNNVLYEGENGEKITEKADTGSRLEEVKAYEED